MFTRHARAAGHYARLCRACNHFQPASRWAGGHPGKCHWPPALAALRLARRAGCNRFFLATNFEGRQRRGVLSTHMPPSSAGQFSQPPNYHHWPLRSPASSRCQQSMLSLPRLHPKRLDILQSAANLGRLQLAWRWCRKALKSCRACGNAIRPQTLPDSAARPSVHSLFKRRHRLRAAPGMPARLRVPDSGVFRPRR